MLKHLSTFSIIIFTFLSLGCSAKTDSNKVKSYAYGELFLGGEFPSGGFAHSTDFDYSGAAGGIVGFKIGVPIKGYFGCTALYSYGLNELQAIPNTTSAQFFTNQGLSFQDNCFIERSLLFGFYYMIPADNKVSFDIKFLAGPLFFSIPQTSVTTGDSSTGKSPSQQYIIEPGHLTVFASDIGASVRCMLTKKFFLSISIDLYSITTEGKEMTYFYADIYKPGVFYYETAEFSNISLINPTIGFGYKIGH